MLYTTIKEILDNLPCSIEKVEKLKTFLGDGFTETTPIPLSAVLKSNGLKHTYWVLSLTEKGQRLLKLYKLWNAEKVLPIWEKKYPNDNTPRLTIEAAKKAIENPTDENKKAARAAADAAYAGARAARAAARAAAREAFDAADAAYAGAREAFDAADAAYAAVFDADAATRAARAAAREAFRKEKEAELLRLIEEATP